MYSAQNDCELNVADDNHCNGFYKLQEKVGKGFNCERFFYVIRCLGHGMLTQKDPFAVLFSVQKSTTGAKTENKESNTGTESNTDATKDKMNKLFIE